MVHPLGRTFIQVPALLVRKKILSNQTTLNYLFEGQGIPIYNHNLLRYGVFVILYCQFHHVIDWTANWCIARLESRIDAITVIVVIDAL